MGHAERDGIADTQLRPTVVTLAGVSRAPISAQVAGETASHNRGQWIYMLWWT